MNKRIVPIPARMQHLERDARGYPIPFNIWRDTDGVAHFTINDHKKAALCVEENRCPICGQSLDKTMWFVGGPMSAFHPNGCYIDQPMHEECSRYALQVCPYLAAPKYAGRIDARPVDPAKRQDNTFFKDPTMLPDRPLVFVRVETHSYTVLKQRAENQDLLHLRPLRPYLSIGFWRGGALLSQAEAEQAVRNIKEDTSNGR